MNLTTSTQTNPWSKGDIRPVSAQSDLTLGDVITPHF